MTIDALQAYCALKPGVSWDAPFGPETLVFRVAGKIFAIAPLDHFVTINLKCDPERAVELRERHEGIIPGWHMNKRHWNTVDVTGSVPHRLLLELIDHSYELVRETLPKMVRESLKVVG